MKYTTLSLSGGLPINLTAVLAAIGGLMTLPSGEGSRSEASAAPFRDLSRLKVSENRRFLVTEDGQPFFWLGDTAWWIFKIPPGDVDKYMAHRARQGFNLIQVHCGFKYTDYADNRSFLNDNPETPNEAYWRNIDAVVEKALKHRLYIALVPMWGDEYGKAFGTDEHKAFRFGQWVGKRYAACRHVLWIVSGEYDAINNFSIPISAPQKSMFVAVARGLRDAHKGEQLMTIHPGNARTSSLDFHAEPWLDFDMLQSAHMIDCAAYGLPENHALIAHDYALEPAKPVLDGEPLYEDTPDGVWVYRDIEHPRADAAAVRRKAYWAVFSGAFGHTYGHNDIYGFNKPSHPGYIVPFSEGPGQRGDWKTSLNAPGAVQMKHLRALVESRPFLDRIPDRSVLSGDAGSGLDHVTATRSSGGSFAMIYCPTGKPVSVALSRLAGSRIKAWWFNPRTGKARPAGQYKPEGTKEFTPPARGAGQDWVLVLDDGSKDYPRPGTRPYGLK